MRTHPLGHARGLCGAYGGFAPRALLVPFDQPGRQLPLSYPPRAQRHAKLVLPERSREKALPSGAQAGQAGQQVCQSA